MLHLELKPAHAKKLENEAKGNKYGVGKLSRENAKPFAKKVDNKKDEHPNELHFKTIEARLASIVVALESKDAPLVEKKGVTFYYRV